MFEYMTTMIVSMILVFLFTAIVGVGVQLLNARLVHSAAIENLQSSYYTYNPQVILDKNGFDDWHFSVKEVSGSVKTRRNYLVTLNYVVNIPLLNADINGKIEGYAR